jgi:hypothetical protein
MGRSKVKTRALKSAVADQDVLDMFQNMVGIGDDPTSGMNIRIVYPKYEKLKVAMARYVKLFDLLLISTAVKHNEPMQEYVLTYITDMKSIVSDLFTVRNLSEMEKLNITGLSKEEQTAVLETYKKIKNNNLTESIILTCKNLSRYKGALEDQTKLSDKFILKMPGLQFCPIFGADGINFKMLYNDPALDAVDRKYLLTILHKLYVISHEIYDHLTSPDIDIDEFVEVIMSSVKEVRKQIPRCDAAFNKIVESVDLLRNNFGEYYKDFVASSNSSVIMENFIIDVSERTEATPKLTAQFRKIISHYRKLASQKNNNPKLQALFKHIDRNFQELEKHTGTEEQEEEEDETPSEQAGELTEIPLDDEPPKDIVVPPFARSPEMLSVKEPASPSEDFTPLQETDSSAESGDSDYDKVPDAPTLDEISSSPR